MPHEAERAGTQPRAGRGPRGDGVGGGDERISAVVVQQGPRALEQDALLAALPVEKRPDRVDERPDALGDARQLFVDGGGIDLGLAQAPPQRVVMDEQAVDLGAQGARVGEVHDPDGAPADLVLVGRANAALRRADLGAGRALLLAERVQFAVQRQDEGGVVGDAKASRATETPCS